MPSRNGQLRAAVRLGRYRVFVTACDEEGLLARIELAKARLANTWADVGPLPAGVEGSLRADGTVRFAATVGAHQGRRRLHTDSLAEAEAWLAEQRAERAARQTQHVRVNVGKWRADWWIPATDDPRHWRYEIITPLLEQLAARIPLPRSVRGQVALDGAITFSVQVVVGAHSSHRTFRSLDEAVQWRDLERERVQSTRSDALTGHAGITRRVTTKGGTRFYVRVEVRGLAATSTHDTLDAAVVDRRRLKRELAALARALHHPWRVRVRYRRNGTALYYARICVGGQIRQMRCDTVEAAQTWLSETAMMLGIAAEPVHHLWEGSPLRMASKAGGRRRSTVTRTIGAPSLRPTRLWDDAT